MVHISYLEEQVGNHLKQISTLQTKLSSKTANPNSERAECQLLREDVEAKGNMIKGLTDSSDQQAWVFGNTAEQLSTCQSDLAALYQVSVTLRVTLKMEEYTVHTTPTL